MTIIDRYGEVWAAGTSVRHPAMTYCSNMAYWKIHHLLRCFSQLTFIYRGAPRYEVCGSPDVRKGCRSTGGIFSTLKKRQNSSVPRFSENHHPSCWSYLVYPVSSAEIPLTSAKSLVLPSFQLSPAASTAPNHREDSPRPDNSCRAARCRRSQGGPGIGELRSLQTLTRHALFNQKTLGFKHNN